MLQLETLRFPNESLIGLLFIRGILNIKHVNEQAYQHELSNFDRKKIGLIPDVELAWTFFRDGFMQIVNKHAPLRRFKVNGRDKSWFSPELAEIIKHNLAWAKARKTGSPLFLNN